jgi:hypothetical protein
MVGGTSFFLFPRYIFATLPTKMGDFLVTDVANVIGRVLEALNVNGAINAIGAAIVVPRITASIKQST